MKPTSHTITEILRLQYPEQYSNILTSIEDIPEFTHVDLTQLWLKFQNEKGAKQLYIGASLYLYSPLTLSINARVTTGLVSAIADVLNCTKANISNQIKEITWWFNKYPEFRNQIIEKI